MPIHDFLNLGETFSLFNSEMFKFLLSYCNRAALGADAGKVFFENMRNGSIYGLSEELFRIVMSHMNHRAVCSENERNIVITCDLILEEDTSVQDEFELFRFLYRREKKTGLVPYYIMNEHSPDYDRIKAEYGSRIVPYSRESHRSFAVKLWKLLLHTKFLCSGFQVLHALNIGLTDAIKKSPYVYSIFTQHGVNFFKDDFISQSAYSSFIFDKIMISNDFEKKLFMERGCYRETDLVKNGLFRWDRLSADNSSHDKSIFIYFTHRRYLRDMEDITDSVYLKSITGLLRNERFNELVKKNGYKVKVALHHSVLSSFGDDILGGIEVLGDAEIADAKRNAAVLITDYSSMCFEMWFQHKPVIFMNIPDKEDCLASGHKTDLPEPYKGKEDYLRDIAENPFECTEKLAVLFENDFTFTEEEKAGRDRFFYYNQGFCGRFCDYLVSMKNEKKDMFRLGADSHIMFSRHSDIYTEGIHFPDSEGRWIVNKTARIYFSCDEIGEGLRITLTGIPHPKCEVCGIALSFIVNGKKLKRTEFYRREMSAVSFDVPASLVGSTGRVDIQIKSELINPSAQPVNEEINTKSRLIFKLCEMKTEGLI